MQSKEGGRQTKLRRGKLKGDRQGSQERLGEAREAEGRQAKQQTLGGDN